MQFDTIARELHRVVPTRFTAERDAAAARLRADGDRELAAAVKGLKRPATAAWLVNLLAVEQPERLADLAELGATLREAQAALDGPRLRALSRQRHDAVRELVGRAVARGAEQDGAPAMTQAVERDVAATLEAALADAAAARAVRSGVLVRTLRSTGLDAVELAGAVAVEGELPPVADPPVHGAARPALRVVGDPGPTPESRRAAPAQRRRERGAAAREAVVEARSTVRNAERELTAAQREHAAAREAQDDARERIATLEEELAQARRDRRGAEQQLETAARREVRATRSRDAARTALERAERDARTASGRPSR